MTTLLGTTGLGANAANSNNSGIFFAIRLQALFSGTITSVGLRIGATNPANAHCAIYADNAGSLSGATRLSGDVVNATTTANAVNTWTISPGVSVVAGQFYWLEFGASGGAFSYTDNVANPDGGTTRDTSGQTTCPTTHATTTGSFTNIFNAFADGVVASTSVAAQNPILTMLNQGGLQRALALRLIFPPQVAVSAPVDQSISPAGLSNPAQFGTPTVIPDQSVSLTGLSNPALFGTLRVDQEARLTGLLNAAQFGVLRLDDEGRLTGLSNPALFGAVRLDQEARLSGFASPAQFGTVSPDQTVLLSGLFNPAQFGSVTIQGGGVVVSTARTRMTMGYGE
jgi:hypothetical protein